MAQPPATVVQSTGATTSQGEGSSVPAEHLVLRLVPRKKKKKVQWAEGTVDNENMGKKSSKKCCIFHKSRPFGEWSDDDDSDADCAECNGEPGPPPPPEPAA